MKILFRLILLDFRLLAGAKSFYIKLILFPALMIFILGTVFHGDSKVKPFQTAFYNADHAESSLGDVLKNDVLKQTDLIRVKDIGSYQEGKQLVESGKVSVFVYVPKGFAKAAEHNEKTSIKVISDQQGSVNGDIVEMMADSFVTRVKAEISEEKAVLKKSGHLSKGDKIISGLSGEREQAVIIPKQSAGNHAAPIDAMQYYSIAMVVMFSNMTAFALIHGIVEERQQHTLFRIKSMPVLRIQYVAGKLLGIMLAILMQMAAVIIASSILYQVKWGNLFEILLVTIVYSFAIGSIVLLWGVTAKNHETVSSMAAPILYGFSFLGGSFIAKDGLPDSLKIVQELIPNGKAINSYVSVTQHAGLSGISTDLAELAAIGAVFLCLTIWVFKRKEAVS
ncbi:ABC transporter permease [Bacillus amyloliquefaciens]|jgi:ABC-2 type transport system permease protein|uniref:ABC transporter permease n=1 Tax=Bacillus amyloliquefaciens TaxID=1390 RepID=UPI0015800730|nr:ABC transporter permease [Bacillus amyloliquefaciens]NUI23014.1 ABC transporter permease [Bacillus amyloliquefaciens]NUI32094.1 ABC transporter permease [Bacillus amyloliquefaciens]NUI35800.1 ABC transporter permease [Bacillus amyloliquefaciens]NUI69647.1 ABC transporter permease [Bacillus amyloliquefaciens]NUI73151.1 ABC transporter permease [Bacillus amyloliquefaciens]